MDIEQTLIIFKPDAVQRGLMGEILMRFEKAGLKVIAMKMVEPDHDHFYKHYEEIGKMATRRGEDKLKVQLQVMMDAPVVPIVLEGVNAVAQVRKMVGTTEPREALPGTIRGDYAHISFAHADQHDIATPNVIHASGDPDEAKLEILHWFNDNEIFDNYETVHEQFVSGAKIKKKLSKKTKK